MRIGAGAVPQESGERGKAGGFALRRRLRWWFKACGGLASVVVPLLLTGLLMTSVVSTPFMVSIDVSAAIGSTPLKRLSGLMERELQRLGAEEVTVLACASGAEVEAGACAAATLTTRFQLSRGGVSALFGGLPALSEQAGAPICGWSYRQEADGRTIRTLALAGGMPIVALVLAVLLVRSGGSARQPLIGTLHGVGAALRMGMLTGALCLLVPLLMVLAMVHWGVPMDNIGDVRFESLEGLLWLTVLLVLCAPLVEEYAFRLRFLDAARKAVGPGVALVLSSLAFAAFHLADELTTMAMYWALGMVLGVLWLRSRSLLACCTAHATYNAAVLAWSAWAFA